MSVAHDKSQVFVVEEFVCYAGRALDQVKRQRSEDAEKRNLPDSWDDGLQYYARPHDPDRDKPLRPAPKPRGGRA